MEVPRFRGMAFLYDRKEILIKNKKLDEESNTRLWISPCEGSDWQDCMEHIDFPHKGWNVPPANQINRKKQRRNKHRRRPSCSIDLVLMTTQLNRGDCL
jgi:hypothetical protein